MIPFDDVKINWDAILRAQQYAIEQDMSNLEHFTWLRKEYGIIHGSEFIRIEDEQKYTMFLLRFA